MEGSFEPNKKYEDTTPTAAGQGGFDPLFCQLCHQSRARAAASSSSSSSSSLGGKVNGGEVGYKLLLRYLNVSPGGVTGGGGGGGVGFNNGEIVESPLCQHCWSLVAEFWKVYKEFENTRLRLWNCLSLVHERMGKGGGEVNGNLPIMKQCQHKLTSFPQVSLMRTETEPKPNKAYKRIQILVKRESSSSSSAQNDKNGEEEGSWSGGGGGERRRLELEDKKGVENIIVKVEAAGSNMEWEPEPATPDSFENEPTSHNEGDSESEADDEQNSQTLGSPTKPRDVKGLLLLTCSHCKHISSDPREHQNHVLCNHPIEFLDEDLKPGTTKEELENAIQQLIGGFGVDKKCQDYECRLCGTLCEDAFDQRAHYLEMHVDSILAILNPTDEVTTSENDNKSKAFELESVLEVSSNGGGRKNSKGRKRVPCKFCGYLSSNSCTSREHMMIHHPASYFKDQISQEGITDEDIAYAVADIFGEGLVMTAEGNVRVVDCKICGGIQRGDPRRLHIFKYHLDLVLSRVGSSSSSRSSSTLKNNSNLAVGVPGLKKVIMATTVKPDHHKEWEKVNGMEMGTACLYCKAVYSKVSRNRQHMLRSHTLQYLHLDNKGVHEKELEQAIQSICRAKRVKNVPGEKYRVDCGICRGVQVVQSNREHILQKHYNLLISSLGVGEHSKKMSKKRNPDDDDGARMCHVCRMFIAKGKLMVHLKTHKRVPIKTINCSHCPHISTDSTDARAHMLTNHTLIVLEPQLRSCGAVGATPHLLEEAIKQVLAAGQVRSTPNRTKRNQFSCLLCPGGKCLTSSMRRHVLQAHREHVILNVQKLLKDHDDP